MHTIQKSNVFGMSKNEALDLGGQNRLRFLQVVSKLPQIKVNGDYSHKFIFGFPGIGKSYEITKHLETSGVKYLMVTGNVSMFAFGVQLAVINYLNPNQERVIVFCDDVDTLVSTEASCNMLKSALLGPKLFTYEKSLQSQWGNLSELQKEAITYHQEDGKMGFQVPTNSMAFIIVSNIQLPTIDEVQIAKLKGKSKATLMGHKHAIRTRFSVHDFSLTSAELWGWIADVVLRTDCLKHFDIDQDEKFIMLNFIWDNWEQLTERSIRLIEKMAILKKEYPDNFQTVWEIDFLK